MIWRDPYSSILTINQQTVTDDDRISVNRPYVKEWNLHIENIKKSDQGTYTCIINSSPQTQKPVTLWVWCKYIQSTRKFFHVQIMFFFQFLFFLRTLILPCNGISLVGPYPVLSSIFPTLLKKGQASQVQIIYGLLWTEAKISPQFLWELQRERVTFWYFCAGVSIG